MLEVVLLDTGVQGALTYPKENPTARPRLDRLRRSGIRVLVPEIADDELRRELLRLRNRRGIERLDALKARLGYVRITTDAMLLAAEFWAQARQDGYATATDEALDADVILAAQARVLAQQQRGEVVIATTNVGHLARFVAATEWQAIT